MFSLHVDTARTWRGGQNQVLLTVNGLRAIGASRGAGRASRRRAAPARRRRARSDSAGAAHRDGSLGRVEVLARAQAAASPTSSTRTIRTAWRWRRWRCRSARGGRRPAPALVASRRVDFHLKGNSFSRWKYRQVDCFIAASEAIRQMLRRRRRAGRRATVTVHEGIDVEHVLAAPPVNVHEAFWLPHQRAGRGQRRRAGAAQGPALPRSMRRTSSCRRCPTRGS